MKSSINLVGLIFIILATILHSCKKEIVPTLTTSEVTNITGTTATSGGTITDEGSGSVIARGVCWSTTPDPTILLNKTSDGAGAGTFVSFIPDLNEVTKYYVRAYATNNAGTGYGMTMSFLTLGQAPTASTVSATNITSTSAELNGNVNANWLNTGVIFEYGTTASYGQFADVGYGEPIIGNVLTNVSAEIEDLIPFTTYHFRVRATNLLGTTYGNDMSFTTLAASGTVTDIDGNTYDTITIGSQVWMAENLKTTRYCNGDLIGTTIPASLNISGETSPKYQWAYLSDESNVATYGRLYTWDAVTDSRKVCPIDWHLPSDAEWVTLENFLIANGFNYDGTTTGNKYAKSLASVSGWTASSNAGAVGNTDYPGKRNSTGFTALPGGYRIYIGSFFYVGRYGSWWSATEDGATYAWYRNLLEISSEVYRLSDNKKYGFSVRCIKD